MNELPGLMLVPMTVLPSFLLLLHEHSGGLDVDLLSDVLVLLLAAVAATTAAAAHARSAAAGGAGGRSDGQTGRGLLLQLDEGELDGRLSAAPSAAAGAATLDGAEAAGVALAAAALAACSEHGGGRGRQTHRLHLLLFSHQFSDDGLLLLLRALLVFHLLRERWWLCSGRRRHTADLCHEEWRRRRVGFGLGGRL